MTVAVLLTAVFVLIDPPLLESPPVDTADVLRSESRYPTTLQGDEYLLANELELATESYLQSMSELEEMFGNSERSDECRELSVVCERLGDLCLSRGLVEEADSHFRRALTLRFQLAEDLRNDRQSQRELWIAHYKIGEAARLMVDYDAAIDHYGSAIEIARSLFATSLDNAALFDELEFLESRLHSAEVARRFLDYDQRGRDPRTISLQNRSVEEHSLSECSGPSTFECQPAYSRERQFWQQACNKKHHTPLSRSVV